LETIDERDEFADTQIASVLFIISIKQLFIKLRNLDGGGIFEILNSRLPETSDDNKAPIYPVVEKTISYRRHQKLPYHRIYTFFNFYS